MLWLLYAFFCAFFLSTTDALCKKALQDTDELIVAWVRFGFALPFLLLASLPIELPHLDETFWHAVLILLPLEVSAILLYLRAIKISPLSLTIPFLALTPVFLIMTSYLMLSELPDKSGALGIILITAGAYLLNFHQGSKGILAPFQSICKEKGSLMMIGVAFIFSLTSNLGKLATLHSNPVFFGTFYTFLLTLVLSPVAVIRVIKNPLNLRPRIKTFLLIGLFYALMTVFHYQALSMVEVAYMISVKRTSLLFSILYGGFLFKESNIGQRLLGSVIMVLGVIFITLM